MNLFPSQSPNAVYVVLESNPILKINPSVIAVTRSYDLALKYMGPCRNITGPIALIGDDIPLKSFQHSNPPNINLDNPYSLNFEFSNSFPNPEINLWGKMDLTE
jgi:hypothetical protein